MAPSSTDPGGIDRFAELMQDPTFRDAFRDGGAATLQEKGVNVGSLPPDLVEVIRFGELLKDQGFAQSFQNDAQASLAAAGVRADALPKGLVDTLAGFSPEELELFTRVQSKLGGPIKEVKEGPQICMFF